MHLTDDELVLHYYGEMSDATEARACEHLESCPDCRLNLTRLQRVMLAIDAAPVPEPAATFEQEMWRRLQPGLASARRRSWLPAWLRGGEREGVRLGAVGWAAAAAVLVLAAFAAGRLWQGPGVAPQTTAAVQEPVRERVLLVDLGDHLDRSELALVEFVSGGDARDVSAGRARAEDLVAANRLYRGTAEATGDRAVADVLDDLERVLIEIAGVSPETSSDDLDSVRRRIDMRGLLFKVRVMRTQLQERVKDTNTNRTKGQETTL